MMICIEKWPIIWQYEVDIRINNVDIEGVALDGVNASAISCHGGNGNKGISIGNGAKPGTNGTAGRVSFQNVHVARTAQVF